MDAFIQDLKERLSQPLPGGDAQRRMMHPLRGEAPKVPDNARKAGVCLLLYPKHEAWHTVLMKRTTRFGNDRHKGQVSFPGGAYETSDTDLVYTALRETEEEIGVPTKDVRILGSLTPLYIPVSNYHVFPTVGFVDSAPGFIPDEDEVASLIETPIQTFFLPENVKRKDIQIHGGYVLKDIPYFDVGGEVVWGATSMMLSEFVAVSESFYV